MERNPASPGESPAGGAPVTDGPPASPHGPPLRRLLVIRFGRIGDILVLTPALRAIARAYPDARVDVLTTDAGVVTLRGNDHVGDVFVLRRRRLPRFLNPERARLVRALRARCYDAVFLFEAAERYHALASALGATRLYGFARATEPPSETRAFYAPDRHAGLRFLDVLALAGIPAAGVAYDFHVDAAARERARDLIVRAGIPEDAPIAGVHAGHFDRRPRRRKPHPKAWPSSRYADVMRLLADRGLRIVLTGGEAERTVNRRIAAEAPDVAIVDFAGRTDLATLAALIERCAVFLSPDTGPAHLAAAVGTPLVALFGPKAPHIMGPLGDDARIARLYAEPSAAPDAARGGHHPRMWAITADDVMAAVARVAGSRVGRELR